MNKGFITKIFWFVIEIYIFQSDFVYSVTLTLTLSKRFQATLLGEEQGGGLRQGIMGTLVLIKHDVPTETN